MLGFIYSVLFLLDTIDFLYENVLPHLEKELEDHGGETRLNDNQKETFLLSDIFPDINEEDEGIKGTLTEQQ